MRIPRCLQKFPPSDMAREERWGVFQMGGEFSRQVGDCEDP